MGAAEELTVEEYLRTSFPGVDREYRDGEILERGSPNFLHGLTQACLGALFTALRKSFSLYPVVETRMQLAPGRFLIPDVAVFYPDRPGSVPDVPPLVAIEVLSPDDRMQTVVSKLAEYATWGVKHVWLVDPDLRKLYVYHGGLQEVESFVVPELRLEVQAKDTFV